MMDFEKYLSAEKREEIAVEVFSQFCADKFKNDAERIFSNAAYRAVWAVVDEKFDGKAAEMVAAKVPQIIADLSAFSVFRSQPLAGEKKGPGLIALEQAIERHRTTLGVRIVDLCAEITKEDVLQMLADGDLSLKVVTQ
jgi:hypothetical protein